MVCHSCFIFYLTFPVQAAKNCTSLEAVLQHCSGTSCSHISPLWSCFSLSLSSRTCSPVCKDSFHPLFLNVLFYVLQYLESIFFFARPNFSVTFMHLSCRAVLLPRTDLLKEKKKDHNPLIALLCALSSLHRQNKGYIGVQVPHTQIFDTNLINIGHLLTSDYLIKPASSADPTTVESC